jgi:hypothetical protein
LSLNASIFKKGLVFITLLVLFLPIIQQQFNLINLYKLAGDDLIKNDTTLSYNTYFTSIYQKKLDQHLNSNFGFRSLLIKINNQLNFSLFHKANAKEVIVGKDDYLFEKPYINAYLGNDFMGIDSINVSLNKLKVLSDKLLKINKQLIIAIAPSKASFYNNYLPEGYLQKSHLSNYSYMTSKLTKMGVNYIDFSKWFNTIKKTTPYALYPKHGNHWSIYGAYLAADSLIKYIEDKKNIHMPNMAIKTIKTELPKNDDKDIEYGINLLFKLPSFELAYPETIIKDTIGTIRPNVLVIGDSFYWNMYNLGFTKCFNKSTFWYYNKAVYCKTSNKKLVVSDLNFDNELNQYDVIIILASELNIKHLGWGFMDSAINYLN